MDYLYKNHLYYMLAIIFTLNKKYMRTRKAWRDNSGNSIGNQDDLMLEFTFRNEHSYISLFWGKRHFRKISQGR